MSDNLKLSFNLAYISIVFLLKVTLQNGRQISIGLKEVPGGDAETYIEALKTTLQELALCASSSPAEEEELRAKLVVSLKNLMSDQCATNGVFNRMYSS